MEKSDDVTFEILCSRTAALELVLGRPTVSLSVTERIDKCENILKVLDREPFSAFNKLYVGLQPLLEQPTASTELLSDDAKRELLSLAEPVVRDCAKQLQFMQELQQYITPPESIETAKHDLASVYPVAHAIAEQERQTEALDVRLATLLAVYENIISTTSRKFVAVDALLTQWEHVVDSLGSTS